MQGRRAYGHTDSQRAIIVRIKRMRNVNHGRRKSFSEIARFLNADPASFPPPAGKRWYPTSIENILVMNQRVDRRKKVKKAGVIGNDYLTVRQAADCFYTAYGMYRMGTCYGHRREGRRGAVVLVLMLTGVRCSELCGLAMRDLPVTHGKNEIIVIGKGSKKAAVQVTPFCRMLLDEVCRVRGMRRTPSMRLFPSESGKRMTNKGIYRIVSGFGCSENLSFLTPHKFRHTYASILLWMGVPLTFVRDQLRHTSIMTTNIYAQTISEYRSDTPPSYIADFLTAINPLDAANRDII